MEKGSLLLVILLALVLVNTIIYEITTFFDIPTTSYNFYLLWFNALMMLYAFLPSDYENPFKLEN